METDDDKCIYLCSIDEPDENTFCRFLDYYMRKLRGEGRGGCVDADEHIYRLYKCRDEIATCLNDKNGHLVSDVNVVSTIDTGTAATVTF